MQDAFRRILVVDDDPDIVTTVALTLELEGFEVMKADSAANAERQIHKHGLPHLALVDIMMPVTDGLEFCRRVQEYCDLPVILLTAVDDDETKVRSIEDVAEDYITKPFHPPELVARVKRVLRRLGNVPVRFEPETQIDEHLAVNFSGKRASVDGKEVSLTPTETKILHILLSNARRTVRTDFLLGRLWPHDEIFEDTLRVHVHRLRQKIEPNVSSPRYLVTHRGEGYVFMPETAM